MAYKSGVVFTIRLQCPLPNSADRAPASPVLARESYSEYLLRQKPGLHSMPVRRPQQVLHWTRGFLLLRLNHRAVCCSSLCADVKQKDINGSGNSSAISRVSCSRAAVLSAGRADWTSRLGMCAGLGIGKRGSVFYRSGEASEKRMERRKIWRERRKIKQKKNLRKEIK